MIGEAYRRFLWHRVTVKRNVTSESDTGATRFNYTVVYQHVPCNIQDKSGAGHLRQEEFGMTLSKKHVVVFSSEWIGKIQHNDVIFVENTLPQETFRIVHVHDSFYNNGHHLECDCETFVPAGDSK